MSLSSDQLDAFFEVSRLGSFSKAARALAISQPALSHRIRKLEDHLETPLFIRSGRQAELTEAGHQLLRLCRSRRDQEDDFIKTLKPSAPERLAGVLRIACYSSIARSLVVPSLADLIDGNPGIRLELQVQELRALPDTLRRGRADFVFTDQPIHFSGVVSKKLGEEKYVLTEPSKKSSARSNIYFDHDVEDRTTFEFWKNQKKPPARIERSFLGEIYAMIDAVENGWGMAVLPVHLVQGRSGLRVRTDLKPMTVPIYLNYFDQPYYSPLHQAIFKSWSKPLR
jgi:DNA-binding transcriptional LysR family regulator